MLVRYFIVVSHNRFIHCNNKMRHELLFNVANSRLKVYLLYISRAAFMQKKKQRSPHPCTSSNGLIIFTHPRSRKKTVIYKKKNDRGISSEFLARAAGAANCQALWQRFLHPCHPSRRRSMIKFTDERREALIHTY